MHVHPLMDMLAIPLSERCIIPTISQVVLVFNDQPSMPALCSQLAVHCDLQAVRVAGYK